MPGETLWYSAKNTRQPTSFKETLDIYRWYTCGAAKDPDPGQEWSNYGYYAASPNNFWYNDIEFTHCGDWAAYASEFITPIGTWGKNRFYDLKPHNRTIEKNTQANLVSYLTPNPPQGSNPMTDSSGTRVVTLNRVHWIPQENEKMIVDSGAGNDGHWVLDTSANGKLWAVPPPYNGSGYSSSGGRSPADIAMVLGGTDADIPSGFWNAIYGRSVDLNPGQEHVIEVKNVLISNWNNIHADDWYGRGATTSRPRASGYLDGPRSDPNLQSPTSPKIWWSSSDRFLTSQNIIYLDGAPIAWSWRSPVATSQGPFNTIGDNYGSRNPFEYAHENGNDIHGKGINLPQWMRYSPGWVKNAEYDPGRTRLAAGAEYLIGYEVNGTSPENHPFHKTMPDPLPEIKSGFKITRPGEYQTFTVDCDGYGPVVCSRYYTNRDVDGNLQGPQYAFNVAFQNDRWNTKMTAGTFPVYGYLMKIKLLVGTLRVSAYDICSVEFWRRNESVVDPEAPPFQGYIKSGSNVGVIVWDDWAPTSSSTRTGTVYFGQPSNLGVYGEEAYNTFFNSSRSATVTLQA